MGPEFPSSVPHESIPLCSPHHSAHDIAPYPLHQQPRPPGVTLKSRTTHQVNSWWTFRLAFFLLLEAGFVILAAYCLTKPILLPLSNNDTVVREAKAFVTVIAVAWHALAVLVAKDIAIHVFSAECIAQYQCTGFLNPGKTDSVSTVTSSLLSKGIHFISRSATFHYRVAFVAVLALMALGPIGPAVLTMTPIFAQGLQEIQLSNLTLTRTFDSSSSSNGSVEDTATDRAELILTMEAFENYTFGYQTVDESVLIPWPQPGLDSQEGAIQYATDVVVYSHNCSWSPPVTQNTPTFYGVLMGGVKTSDGKEWTTRLGSGSQNEIYEEIERFDMIMPLVTTMYSSSSDNSTSAFLFLGGPAKPADDKPVNQTRRSLDLTGIPSIPFIYGDSDFSDQAIELRASVLLCEPRPDIFPADVLFKKGALHLVRRANASPHIGNIPAAGANVIFTQALFSATRPDMDSNDIERLSDHSISLFLKQPQDHTTGERKLLSLDEINQNMNSYMQIAAKAYLSGTVVEDSSGKLARTWITQNGAIERQQPALIASKPFLYALIALIGLLALLLSSLLVMSRHNEMQTFDLNHFTIKDSITQKQVPLLYSGYEDLSASRPSLSKLNILSGTRFSPKDRLVATLRLITFVILEVAFIILCIRCLLKPIPLSLSNEDSRNLGEAKAVTTAISVVWHALAALVVEDLMARVFSAECMAQYRLTDMLKPGETDRASTITAGLFSKLTHFISGTATSQYRIGFVAALVLMTLGPIGPSVITVTSVTSNVPEEIQLSNLTLVHTISLDSSNISTSEDRASGRAQLILRMETSENYTFGYPTAEERLLIPWPQPGLESREGAIRYSTDVVAYNYSCSWNLPTIGNETFDLTELLFEGKVVMANGQERQTQVGAGAVTYSPGYDAILPLTPPTDSSLSQSAASAFLFFGGPAGPRGGPLNRTSVGLDLSSIPSSTALMGTAIDDVLLEFRASVLLCEPNLRIYPGDVLLERGTLHLVQQSNNPRLIGNIPGTTANVIFTQALAMATQPVFSAIDLEQLTNYSMSLFIDPSQNDPSKGRKILPLETINGYMNSYLQIAAKAYLNGVVDDNSSSRSSRRSTAHEAMSERQQPVLAASKPFLIALIVIVGVLTILLSGVLVKMDKDMRLFDLDSFTIRGSAVHDEEY